jgi:hypothetical protein
LSNCPQQVHHSNSVRSNSISLEICHASEEFDRFTSHHLTSQCFHVSTSVKFLMNSIAFDHITSSPRNLPNFPENFDRFTSHCVLFPKSVSKFLRNSITLYHITPHCFLFPKFVQISNDFDCFTSHHLLSSQFAKFSRELRPLHLPPSHCVLFPKSVSKFRMNSIALHHITSSPRNLPNFPETFDRFTSHCVLFPKSVSKFLTNSITLHHLTSSPRNLPIFRDIRSLHLTPHCVLFPKSVSKFRTNSCTLHHLTSPPLLAVFQIF